MIREPAAIASWVLLVAFSVVPAPSRVRASTLDTILTALVFFVAAMVTRYWLRETESRWQMLAFVAMAIGLALARSRIPGRGLSWMGVAVSAGSAVAGVLVVKIATEGVPF